jgi:hypothetical protein
MKAGPQMPKVMLRLVNVMRASMGHFDDAAGQIDALTATLKVFDEMLDQATERLAQSQIESQRRMDAYYKACVASERLCRYWQGLWFVQGKEYGNAQDQMCAAIDDLKRKLGIFESPYMTEQQKANFRQRVSGPHPNPLVSGGSEGEPVDDPPLSAQALVDRCMPEALQSAACKPSCQSGNGSAPTPPPSSSASS